MNKETIYLDNDDEIASIIDKIQSAKSPIVAMVLPKRCTVLQSLVNMKILQRAAKTADKKVVLITTEAALLPVAGVAGMYVAKSLQSKPVLPPSPKYEEDTVDTVNESDDDPELDTTKTIGELAGVAVVASAAASKVDNDDEAIELGDEPSEKDVKKDKKSKNKDKKNKKLAVPNFDSFRVKLFAVIGGIILLAVLWFVANNVLPRAKVTIKTENKVIAVDLTATASQKAKSIDADTSTLPAETKTMDKTETKKFAATGDKNVGTKASGTMTIYNCTDNTATVPAGSAFSSSGFTFVTTEAVTVSGSNFTSSGKCKEDGFEKNIAVVATAAGDQYNLSAGRTFSSNISGGITSVGSAMAGGTTKNVKVISQSDCDSAKNDLLNTKTDDYKAQLATQLQTAGLVPIKDTFTVTQGTAVCTPAVDQEAAEGTASVTIKMSMVGVNTAGLNQLIENDVKKQIEGSQTLFDTGIKNVNVSVKERKANGDIVIKAQTDAQTGIKQDADAIAKSIAGKKRGDSLALIRSQPGVAEVEIKYTPFWVSKTPKNVKHVTVVFEGDGSK